MDIVQTWMARSWKKLKIDANATIVMCSAMGQESMVVEAIRNGAKDFIVKPLKLKSIENCSEFDRRWFKLRHTFSCIFNY